MTPEEQQAWRTIELLKLIGTAALFVAVWLAAWWWLW